MTSRMLSLRRGKAAENQRFSLAFEVNPNKVSLLQNTLTPDISAARRSQIWADPMNCSQFACRWDGSFGFFTRPTISQEVGADGAQSVVGSFTDTIGQVYPISVPLDDFQGFFSTLVRRGNAERFRLPIYPKEPDTIHGPPLPQEGGRGVRNRDPPAPVEPSMERLNWDLPEDHQNEDEPVIALLPMFLPIGPGQSFPHMHALDSETSFAEEFPLLEVWRMGMVYAHTHNEGHSVTTAGPLFHLPSVALDVNVPNPFETYPIRQDLFVTPTLVGPHDTRFTEVSDTMHTWADYVWMDVGSRAEPETVPPQPLGEGINSQAIRNIVEPIVNRDKEFRLSARTIARFRLLFGTLPAPDSETPLMAVLPDIKEEFQACLKLSTGAAAADELKEMTRTAVRCANASRICVLKDVTFDPDCVTLAFSDRVRTFSFVADRLVSLTQKHAETNLGILHFLTPVRAALAQVAEGDANVRTLVMANASNSASQIDATKSSKLYTGGRLSCFRDLYEAVCNVRLVGNLMVEDIESPLVIQKLTEYVDLLMDTAGKSFWEAYRNHPNLPIHAYQDLQHILTAFVIVATDSSLGRAVLDGGQVTASNYDTAIAVADGHISNLRTVINGNGLGSFRDVPFCASWFAPVARVVPQVKPSSALPGAPSSGTAGPARPTPADLAKLTERLRALGILEFDASSPSAKTNFLDKAPIKARKKGGKVPERLCMKFLTKGFACTDPKCKRPHTPNINTLPESDRRKFVEFVSKTPGLSWVSGKEPAGTVQ